MKTSCSTKLLESIGAENIFQGIDLAVELGFDGINVDCVDGSYFSIENFSFLKSAEIVRYAIAKEIEIQCISVAPINFNKEKDEIKRLNKAATVAHALSCPLVTFSASVLDEKTGILKQYDKTSEIIKKSSKFAADFDICFAVEAVPGTIVDTFEKSLQLFVDVDAYNFGVVLNSISLNKNVINQVKNDINLIDESLLLVKISGEEEKESMNDILFKLNKQGYSLYISDCHVYSGEETKKELLKFVKFIKKCEFK